MREVLPKRKSLYINVQCSDIGIEAVRADHQVAEVISRVAPKNRSPLIDVQSSDIGFATACAGRQQVVEVVHKVLKSPFIDAQDVTARAGFQQVVEVAHKVLKS